MLACSTATCFGSDPADPRERCLFDFWSGQSYARARFPIGGHCPANRKTSKLSSPVAISTLFRACDVRKRRERIAAPAKVCLRGVPGGEAGRSGSHSACNKGLGG